MALLELISDANEVVEVDMTTLHAEVPDSLSTTQEGLVFKRLRLYCVVLGITILESKTYSLYFLLNSPVGLQKIIHLVKVELRPNIFIEHRVCHKNVRWLKTGKQCLTKHRTMKNHLNVKLERWLGRKMFDRLAGTLGLGF